MTTTRCYNELIKLKTFEERFEYLKLGGKVGDITFGYDRYLNQTLYRSNDWKKARRDVIIRDEGCDLGIEDRIITGRVMVHHMNPISIEDIENRNPEIFNPDYLITVSYETHNAIHYGDEKLLMNSVPNERKPNDTCPWKG